MENQFHKYRPWKGRSIFLCVITFILFIICLVAILPLVKEKNIVIIIVIFLFSLNIFFSLYSILKLNSFVYMDDDKIQQKQYGKLIQIYYENIKDVKISHAFYAKVPPLITIYDNKKKISFEMTIIFD